ncbi:hypothetical protein BGW80DRAFT_1556544 [Lactifluus volemus]|nr:hypothetical protein BGW80DRAFT_1556544 [Lactifluus volemus]
MPATQIDILLKLWEATLAKHGDAAPFSDHRDLYATIDSISFADTPWESFNVVHNDNKPDRDIPSWMTSNYDVWFRNPRTLLHNLISNPDFDKGFDYVPFREYDQLGNHRFQDFMSGNWAWKQADLLAEDDHTHGSMFVPIILGSDKTTVSIATGNNEYWPIYMSIGNICNNIRRAHRNGVVLLGFFAIPKSEKKYASDASFRRYRRQLFHTTLAKILKPLEHNMTIPEVVRCPDGHFRRAIYGLGPYIADYPEQALLASIVQGWCPKCTAPPHEFDKPGLRRCQEHTEALVEARELGELWDEYGLVGDIILSIVRDPPLHTCNITFPSIIRRISFPDFRIIHTISHGVLNRIRDILDVVKAQADGLWDGQLSTKCLLDELRQHIPRVPDNGELVPVDRLQRIQDLINGLAEASRPARPPTPEESPFDSGSDTSTMIRPTMAELLRPSQPPTAVQIQPPPAFVPLNFRPDARGPRPRSASPTLLTELPPLRPFTVPIPEPLAAHNMGLRPPGRPERIPVCFLHRLLQGFPQRSQGPTLVVDHPQMDHGLDPPQAAVPPPPIIEEVPRRATMPAVLQAYPPLPPPHLGVPGAAPAPLPFTQSVILPPIFNEMMAMVRVRSRAASFGNAASLEQQHELMRYMGSLNDWLGNDVADRQAEIRSTSDHLDQLRDDVNRLCYPRYPQPGSDLNQALWAQALLAHSTLGVPRLLAPPPGVYVPPSPMFPRPYSGAIPPVIPGRPSANKTPTPSDSPVILSPRSHDGAPRVYQPPVPIDEEPYIPPAPSRTPTESPPPSVIPVVGRHLVPGQKRQTSEAALPRSPTTRVAGTPFTNDFPRADIHELLSPDLLHQVIKGTFKDHLVTWVEQYLVIAHCRKRANDIMDDIDHRIAIVAPFSGLRRFPRGRGFKQWTGDDSKALMKVYLPAIQGHVPQGIVRTFRAFLEFCYIARHDVIDTPALKSLEDALSRFHQHRAVFEEYAVRPGGFSLPRQHSLVHYASLIRLFGAPNGLCSSITESKHIKAIKEPWRRSNRYNALDQILLTNQRLDKLASCRVDFTSRAAKFTTCNPKGSNTTRSHGDNHDMRSGDLNGGTSKGDKGNDYDGVVDGPTVLAHTNLAKTICRKRLLSALAVELGQPDFVQLIQRFLCDQLPANTNDLIPEARGNVSVYTSAISTFHAPSDLSGIGGMRSEYIRATSSWRKGPPRYDCVFVNTDPALEGLRGLEVARVRLFFSFKFRNTTYPCALVHWMSRIGDGPNEETGMWVVEPDFNADGSRFVSVIHLDAILRAAHLIPVYGVDFISKNFSFHDSLDRFSSFYVNKFIDHHAFEIAF